MISIIFGTNRVLLSVVTILGFLVALLLIKQSLADGRPLAANAQELYCKGILGSIVVENLVVPSGHTCHLKGTIVKGNVIVGQNASLFTSQTRVRGDIISKDARCIDIGTSTQVSGNVLIPKFTHCKLNPKF